NRSGRRSGQLTPGRYGWVVVAAAFTLMFVGFAAAYSFAAFFGAFQAEFGASRGHVALVFSVAAFLWFLLGAPGGVAADRFGPRGAYLALAVFVLVLGGAAALAIRQQPGIAAAGPASGMPLRLAVRTPAFWFIYASLVLSCVGLFVPMVHLSPYAQDAGYTE